MISPNTVNPPTQSSAQNDEFYLKELEQMQKLHLHNTLPRHNKQENIRNFGSLNTIFMLSNKIE